METKIYEYPIIPYPRVMWVCYGVSEEEIKKKFISLRDSEWSGLLDDASQMQTWDVEERDTGRYGYLVCCKNKKKMREDYLSHEACHVAVDLFRVIGCEVNDATQEPFAYMQQFLFNCLKDAKKNKK